MRRSRFRTEGARAVVTGAASGIGAALAHELAARGAHLVLLDRDAERLTGVAASVAAAASTAAAGATLAAGATAGREAGDRDTQVRTVVADLADVDRIPAVAQRVREAAGGVVDLLVNNAGVALQGEFRQLSAAEFDWVLDVNLRAPVALCRELLPFVPRGGHVVNVSSVFGLTGPPGQSAYATSKFGLRGFSESLRHELAADGIGVTVVLPGGIRTRIAESARVAAVLDRDAADQEWQAFARLLTHPPERVAVRVVDAVERRRARVLVTAAAVGLDVLVRVAPTRHAALLRPAERMARRLVGLRPAVHQPGVAVTGTRRSSRSRPAGTA